MKINITKKEYVVLMDMLEMVGWVLFGFSYDENPGEKKRYRDFEQKIYGFAKEMGADHLVMYENDPERYFPTQEYDDNSPVMDYMKAYNEESFWDELIERFSLIKLIRKEGESKVMKMSPLDRYEKQDSFRIALSKEFETNGLSNLDIISR